MQQVYIEQESQTETPYENLSTDTQEPTQPQQQNYQGPFYLKTGPQNQILLIPVAQQQQFKQNGQNIQGVQIIQNMTGPFNLQNSEPAQVMEMQNKQGNVQQIQYQTQANNIRRPITIKCPYCGYIGVTRVQYTVSNSGLCCAFLLLITIPIFCLLPFCMRDCQNVQSFCQFCNKLVGEDKK